MRDIGMPMNYNLTQEDIIATKRRRLMNLRAETSNITIRLIQLQTEIVKLEMEVGEKRYYGRT